MEPLLKKPPQSMSGCGVDFKGFFFMSKVEPL